MSLALTAPDVRRTVARRSCCQDRSAACVATVILERERSQVLSFEPSSHRYFWDGQHVPGVTSILSSVVDYSRIPAGVLERARQEGTAIHKMIELYEADDLDDEALPDWLRPRFCAYLQFLSDTRFQVHNSERKVFHRVHKYAGQLDLDGELKDEMAIIDIKRSLFAGPAIGLQTAAYQEAENDRRKREKLPKITRRYALQLKDDGSYKLEPYTDPQDFATFLALLTLQRWRQKNGSNDS